MRIVLKYINKIMPLALVFFVVLMASFVLNRAFKIDYLTGDDLNTFYSFQKVSFFEFVFDMSPGRFRPVSSVFLWLQFYYCGDSLTRIQWYNIFAMALFSTLIFFMLYSMSHSYIESFIAVILITVSRFSWYNVTQVYGRMENICILLAVAGLWSLSRYKNTNRSIYFGITIVAYILAIFGHERYFLLFIPYSLFYLVQSKGLKKLAFSLSFVLVFIAYYVLKVYLLKIGFSADTGGSTGVSFSFLGALKNAICALINILELPIAEDYLVGLNYSMMTESMQTLSVFLTLLNAILLLFAIIVLVLKLFKEGIRSFLSVEFAVLLSCALMLGPAAVAQRLEMRFIYCSFILLNIVFALNVRIIKSYVYRGFLCTTLSMGIIFSYAMVRNASPFYYIIQIESEANTYYNALYVPFIEEASEHKICFYMDTNVDSARNFLAQYEYPKGVDFVATDKFQEYFNSLSIEETYTTLFIHVNSSFETEAFDADAYQYINLDDWILGTTYTRLFIGAKNNLNMAYYVPENFEGVKYNIYVDGTKVKTLDNHFETGVYTYTYESESLIRQMHYFTIEIDDSNLPENYRGNDIRELLIYILFIECAG